MSDELKKLEELARSVRMTAEQQEQQRRSFAYGNAGLENDLITREMVDEQAEKMKRRSA
ncbi:MAG: hypothetical protein AB7P12_11485 [Alphaproteobacteria bacterium]